MAMLHTLGFTNIPAATCDPSLGPMPAECAALYSNVDYSTGGATPEEQAAAAEELRQLGAPLPSGSTVPSLTAAQQASLAAFKANELRGQWIPGVSNAVILLLGGGLALLAFAGGRR